MTRDEEYALIEEILELDSQKSAFLDEAIAHSPTSRYASADRFLQERDHIFTKQPTIIAHASELPEENSFLTRDYLNLPVLLTRDEDGKVHAYLNVCRHRGATLERGEKGCKRLFSCPYHAWTWSNKGDLVRVPHEKQGFPDLDMKTHSLRKLPVEERFGFIWVLADSKTSEAQDIDAHLAPLTSDFTGLDLSNHHIVEDTSLDLPCNWKMLIEGSIEAYHFRVAHKDTIGPYFPDNLSTYQMLGAHIRSVLPRNTFGELRDLPRKQWVIRRYANIVYTVFPTSLLLAQQDHCVWIQLQPLSESMTRTRLATLAPNELSNAEDMTHHWKKNHSITVNTLLEDFQLGEEIQKNLACNANTVLTFGRFEGALEAFNRMVELNMKQNTSIREPALR
ncbi:ribosomal subunit interface protein [Pseudovibrio japonicus]|uniref:Ribosomal subunit interface protein n=1 Tax=Pseudovibrio japonicus TaxID=366534 RepID=A0ABQ3EF63_9HYPH|nr:aromatic ring-hydroxylating dioxygenase subunit alpha [Pseudovibrio japonicus]GHB36644.1 ribosomal subunit interface protein [Pseudovibrio japonicus]